MSGDCRIIERGSHEKLIAEKGTYYRLYTGAFELEYAYKKRTRRRFLRRIL